MKKFLLIMIFIINLISAASSKENKTISKDDPFVINDFYIERVKDHFIIKSNLHITELEKYLKDANKSKIELDKNYPEFKTHYYYFDGLIITGGNTPEKYCDDNSFEITNKNYKTYRDIIIGDSREKVLEKYGAPDPAYYKPDDEVLSYFTQIPDYNGEFSIDFKFDREDRVILIRIEFGQRCT